MRLSAHGSEHTPCIPGRRGSPADLLGRRDRRAPLQAGCHRAGCHLAVNTSLETTPMPVDRMCPTKAERVHGSASFTARASSPMCRARTPSCSAGCIGALFASSTCTVVLTNTWRRSSPSIRPSVSPRAVFSPCGRPRDEQRRRPPPACRRRAAPAADWLRNLIFHRWRTGSASRARPLFLLATIARLSPTATAICCSPSKAS
jgi:hypothetical protein